MRREENIDDAVVADDVAENGPAVVLSGEMEKRE